MKSLLSNFQSALLHSTRWTPSIKPQTATFLHKYANDFANTANPVSIPVFLFLNGQWRGGGGVEGSTVEGYMLCLTKNSTPLEPRPNLILFDLLHCYEKFIHAVGDHHRPRKNTRLSAQHLFGKQYLIFFTRGQKIFQDFATLMLGGKFLWTSCRPQGPM